MTRFRRLSIRPLGPLAWASLLALGGGLALCAAPAHAQDIDPPVIEVLEGGAALTDGALFAGPVTITFQVTDASPVTVDATVDGAAFTTGGTVSGEGSHELVVTATDDAQNSATLTRSFEIDTIAPVFGPVLPGSGTLTAAADVTLQGEVTGAAAVTVAGAAANLVGGDFSAGPLALSEGETSFTIVATDAAGNSAQVTHRIVRDSTPPTVAIEQPAEGALRSEASVDVVGTATDPHLDAVTVAGTAASRTGSTFLAVGVPLAEGSNAITAQATDAAGNSAQASRTIVLDTQAPALAITDPAAGTVLPSETLTVRGSASDPHLDRVEVNGVPAVLSAGTWSGAASLEEGANTITVEAFDRLGWSAAATVTVTRDTTAPAVTLTAPADGVHLQGDTVTVTGTVDDAGATVTVGGGAAALDTGASPPTFSATVPLVEGENRLIARVTDGVGNQGARSRVIYRDTVAPTFVAVDPGDGALAIPPESRFEITLSEPLGTLAGGAWSLERADGTTIAAQGTVDGAILTVLPDAPLPSDTEVRLILTAGIVDRAGNALEAPPTLTWRTKDVVAPDAPVLAAQPPSHLCASELALSGTAEAEAEVEVTGGAGGGRARADETGAFALVVDLAPSSLNRLEVTALDVDGNRSAAAVVEVVQDCQGPSVTGADLAGDVVAIAFDEPVDPATLTAASVTLSASTGALAGGVAVTGAGAGATFTADAPLPAEPLRLEVTPGVRDLAGNPLAFPYTERFGASVTPSFLAGRVIDAATGRPLAGATVVVDATDGVVNPEPRPEQITGGRGRFRLPVAAGTHYLVALRPGYTPVFRIVPATGGEGADVFDPRLTPTAPVQTVPAAGGELTGADGLSLDVPSGALGADAEVSVTSLDEQALPALLPYGWSPRGAVWIDLGGAALAAPATLTLPVDAAAGAPLALVRLDLATLQWQVEAVETLIGSTVTIPVDGEGAWAAVEADGGSLAPPAPIAGTVLGSASAPAGGEVTAAAITFDPTTVLPSQTSRATVVYTLASQVPSGAPLTVVVQEELTLLDGTTRREAPYEADLMLFRSSPSDPPAGSDPRSAFDLAPSAVARSVPFEMGAEDVTVRPYAGETVQGNVVGPTGGTVTTAEGDLVDLPAGALADTAPVLLARVAEGDLLTGVPAGTEYLGALALDLSGRELASAATLTLELGAAPAAGEEGLLFQVLDLPAAGGIVYRPVAALAATASGWTTAAIDPADLPWPGVREAGTYVFARLTGSVGYLRGTVFGVGGAPRAGALVTATDGATAVPWVQLSHGDGSYVLPVPVAALTVAARDSGTGDEAIATPTVSTADERVDLDLFLQVDDPQVVTIDPADGATEVLTGIEPTIAFSEPVDPSTVTNGVQLVDLGDGQQVPASVEVQGSLVRLRPLASLRPATGHEIRVTTAVRDLQGNRVAAAVTSGFTTRDDSANSALDLTRVHLFEPDPLSGGAGDARVLGRAGAVPAGTLVFVENLSRLIATPSVTAAADGGFELFVEAELTDRLLLHVVLEGQNEVVVELTPFLTADGRGARIVDEEEESVFTTLDGITIRVPEDTFRQPTTVTVEPRALDASPAPVPGELSVLYAYELDFAGAEAFRAVEIAVPAPAAGTPGLESERFFVMRTERVLGDSYWMLYDLMVKDGDALTTELPPEELAGLAVPAGSGEALAAVASLGSPAVLLARAGGLAPTAFETITAPARLGDQKDYLPGSANPGLYTVMYENTLLDFVGMPSVAGNYAYYQSAGLEGIVTTINAKIASLLERDAILMPTRAGEDVKIVARDLTTGYKLWEETFEPAPEGEILFLPPDSYGDLEAPIPVAGSPLRFYRLTPTTAGTLALAPGVDVELTAGDELVVTGSAGASGNDVQVRLLGIEDSTVDVASRSQGEGTAAPGSFEVRADVTPGETYLLAIGAEVGTGTALEIGFSEALDPAFPGLGVKDSQDRDAKPEIEATSGGQVARISPKAGWKAGETYTLTLGPELADAAGNEWERTLSLELRVRASEPRDTYELAAVRDVERIGGLLFVAGDEDGLVVLDASDPANLEGFVNDGTADLHFPFPGGDPVRGLSLDPHGRLLVVGGGVASFGQLKIFDPLAMDPAAIAAAPGDLAVRTAAYRGSTIVSDSLGGVGTQLPEGTPRKVAVLSQDRRDTWRIGVDPPPAGVTLDPAAPPAGVTEYTVTVSGSGPETPDDRLHPVTLRDLTRGRWHRVDADSTTGAFSLQMEVGVGSTVELIRNDRTLAYVATLGVGLEVVDVDAFYGETPEDPQSPSPESDVLGIYTGNGEGLELCEEPVSHIGGATIDMGTLFDPDPQAAHPLTAVGLIGFRGLALLESDPEDVGAISFYGQLCLEIEGSARVSGMEVLEDYHFDLDGDGLLEEDEGRDYLLVTHLRAGLLVIDATDRDDLSLVSRIRLPGSASHLGIDRENRRVFVAAAGEGVYVVDLDGELSPHLLDEDQDGTDDRVLETIELEGGTNAPVFLVPELGLAYAGGVDNGLTSIAVGEPRIFAVAESAEDSTRRRIDRLAPFGVPTVADGSGEDLAGAFRVMAYLPGGAGAEVTLDVTSLGPGGVEIRGAGDPATLTDLPPTALTGADGLVLTRLSDNPLDEGYQLYLSEEVAALADLRAASAFERTTAETDACEDGARRCDVPEDAREILSGLRVAVRFPAALRSALGPVYGASRLDEAELELASVPWDTSPALRQEPTLNPSLGAGDVAPGTLLHSGESSHQAIDLAVQSRGFDFAFTRTYRSQTVGAGPLGPGWDLSFNQRLRELPNGDVEYHDGRGRRELFRQKSADEGTYEAPEGRFVELTRTTAGWVWIDARRNQMRFDRFGRLVSIADAVKVSEETGNLMRFRYDASDRLVAVVDTLGREYTLAYDAEGWLTDLADFTGRTVTYEYDADGRLERVLSPEVTIGVETPGRLETTYGYDTPSGTLAARLTKRDDLTSITDARGITWLTHTYTDADGDGRADEVTGQTWGGDPLTIAYDFGARTATVTDRRGSSWGYRHDEAGRPIRTTDPATHETVATYDAEGLLKTVTEPLGRVTTYSYPTNAGRRSRGNATEIRVTPGTGGPNGSSAELVTSIVYETATNQPFTVTDPRGGVTTYVRNEGGNPTEILRPESSTTRMEYDDYGRVEKVINPNGHVTRYDYFESGEAEGYLQRSIVDPGGLALVTRHEVDPRGNVTAEIDPRGTRHETRYNALDWRVGETADVGGLGYVTSWLYDEVGQVLEVDAPYGLAGETYQTTITYGALGEMLTVAREIQPGTEVATTTTVYDENRNATRITDPNGNVTTIQYDARNLPEIRTLAEGKPEAITESFLYDAEGRLTRRTDGRGNDWHRAYDGYGRLASSEDPLGNRTEQLYDDASQVKEIRAIGATEGLLAKSETRYDLLGRPDEHIRHLWTDDPGSATEVRSTIGYDLAGNVLTETDPMGRVTTYGYDAAERMTSRLDAVGNEVVYEPNATGQPERVTLHEAVPGATSEDPATVATTTTTHEYDALGRLESTTDPLGNTTTRVLDAAGRARLVIDAENNQTERVYDSLGRMLSETLPEGIRIELGYDLEGNRTSYQDARGQTTTWEYDALDRLEKVTYPDAQSESYAYDGAGNVETITQPSGTTVTQVHDAANRLVSRTIALVTGVEGPAAESFQHDGLGRLTQATSGSGASQIVSTRAYDSLSRMTSEATAGRTVAYQHDAAGSVTGITYPSGVTVTHKVDDLGRLEEIQGVASWAYRGPDRVARTNLGVLQGTTTYDGARRPKTRDLLAGSQRVFSESMTWTPRDLLEDHSRLAQNDTAFRMEHDNAGRLEQRAHLPSPGAATPDETTTFSYDAAQNRTQVIDRSTEDPRQVSATPPGTANRPQSLDGVSLTWSAAGNLSQKGDRLFHYDWRSRLVRVSMTSGADLARYSYDVFDRLVQRLGSTTEETVWAGWQPIELYRDGQLAQRRTYGLGLDEIVRLEVDLDGDGSLERMYTPLYDQTGNLAAVTDLTGEIVERYEYSPFGLRLATVDSMPPEIQQLLYRDGGLRLDLSEEILRRRFQSLSNDPGSVTSGLTAKSSTTPPVTLLETTTGTEIPVTVDFPVELGRFAFHRATLTPTGTPPAAGTEVTLRIEAEAVQDTFFHSPSQAFETTFLWPAGETVLADTAPPEVEEILKRDGDLEIAFSEEVDLTTAQSALTIDGQTVAWEMDPTGYRLRTVDPLDAGAQSLTVGTGVQDLAGLALTAALTVDLTDPIATADPAPVFSSVAALGSGDDNELAQRFFQIPDSVTEIFYRVGEANQILTTATDNRFGFHGREIDFTTGLVYFRHRWYDPEMGRFLQQDPLGYVDGPNLYQYALNNPASFSDPLGLYCRNCREEDRTREARLAERERQREDFETLQGSVALVAQLEGVEGVETNDVQLALWTYLKSRPNMDRRVRAGLIGALTGSGEGNGAVVAHFEGSRYVAQFFEQGLIKYPLMVAGGEAVIGARGLFLAIRQIGFRNAAGQMGQVLRSGFGSGVGTPYGPAFQDLSEAALAARAQVQQGAMLYRVGTTGRSAAMEAQFWALEHPLTPGFASRYGIPPGNVQNFNFIEAGRLRPGSPFVTRQAPGVGSNVGGGIEVVVPEGGVWLRNFAHLGGGG